MVIQWYWVIIVFLVVQSLSRVWLFVTPWTAACQAFLSGTISWSLFKLMSIESVMPSNHLILCLSLLLLPSIYPCFLLFKIFYFWLHWVFAALHRCMGFNSCSAWVQYLQTAGSRAMGSVVVVHGLKCSTASEIFLDQGLNLCPLQWQADSHPLHHREILLSGFPFEISFYNMIFFHTATFFREEKNW